MSEKVTKEQFFDKLNADQQAVTIPYYVHEGEMYRVERLNRRWFIAFIIVLLMLFVTNGAWIAYEVGYETYYVAQDVNTGAAPAVLSGTGDVTYAEN